MIDQQNVIEALTALAHDARLEVFRMLTRAGSEGLAAGVVAARLAIAPSALSFHLARLRHAGLITSRRAGQRIIYRVRYARMEAVLAFMTEHCCADSANACSPVCKRAERVDSAPASNAG